MSHDMGLATCKAKKNFTKRNPSFLLVPLKIVDDVFWVERLECANIVLDQVINSDTRDEEEPHNNNWSKHVTNLVGPEVLHREEGHQNPHCDQYYLIYSKVTKSYQNFFFEQYLIRIL